MRVLPLVATLAWLGAGQANDAVDPAGSTPSGVTASGTIRAVQMADLAEGAGFRDLSSLANDADGIWRGRGGRDGRIFEVGFDDKGQVAFR